MRRSIWLINTYLAALLLFSLGCSNTEERKREQEASTLRFHLEAPPQPDGSAFKVPIYRAKPYLINVRQEPFLDEGDIASASVVEEMGGFAIRVQFNEHGKLILQSTTAGHRGRRIAVLGTWTEARWLGAPVVNKTHTDGVFTFTPDASREEAERIVRGINNLIELMKRKSWVL